MLFRSLALVMGDLVNHPAPLVRLHSSGFTGDLVDSLRCDCGDQFHEALRKISEEGCGAMVYLPQEGRGIGLVEKIKAYALQETGLDTVEANLALGHKADTRDYGIGLQILKDLGLHSVRLLTNNPKKTNAFVYGGFNLKVVDQVPITVHVNQHNAHYLGESFIGLSQSAVITVVGTLALAIVTVIASRFLIGSGFYKDTAGTETEYVDGAS